VSWVLLRDQGRGWDHLGVLLSLVYRLLRCLLGLLAVLVRSDLSKDAELLVLRHENQVLRCQLSGRLRWDHADRVWLAALSRVLSRRRWAEVFPVTPGYDLAVAPGPRRPQVGLRQPAQARTAVHRDLG
jgi:putative transposase